MRNQGLNVESSKEVVARVDLLRSRRIGMPEAVYCQSKTVQEILAILKHHRDTSNEAVLLTRCNNDVVGAVSKLYESMTHPLYVFPGLEIEADYRTIVVGTPTKIDAKVGVLTAGTSDLRVAHECMGTLFALGIHGEIYADVGVAHVDRVLEILPRLEDFDVIVVVAGMEGALASVVGGLVSQPVVAVPTSAGYGSSFDGLTALLAMTATCAQGVSVMGIDNGFGAACAAFRVVKRYTSRAKRL
ncbi:hypothetical protein SAMN02745225_00917 [Ferrithrix thermotolerans DSM 19514]|uniref:PurE domain-containing protein n=1 Tax=Ferrithrix thermotolerans DSM 19514 TaxID=1121881 RepID=A0A1M4UC52_9ACTN|nr:nickel pincer cofactor biosynthesis protein LarB [Ferrithrix thermotolerans]SHE54130.1 hypothetical protein SAMN02745225_00917 [Ferrithrix thermotolerans DSM 19514]